jgi:hypothetical protein
MRTALLVLLCGAAACTGCDGGSQGTPDGSSDGAGDGAGDGEAGPCGAERFVTGALVDLDSSDAQFMGVFNARFTVEGHPAKTTTTAPNGRFELCAPAAQAVILDVDAPGAYLDGKAYLEAEALDATTTGRPLTLRAYTQARAAGLYTFDPARAHVLVFVAGDRSDLTLDRAHGAPLAASDDDGDGAFVWAPGRVGRYVLFPNVDVSSPTISLGGDTSGPHLIPVAAGKLTLVAIFFVFV